MKPTPSKPAPILAFGAHPDDIEFGCGGVVARETQSGRPVHFVVCSLGEAGSNGTPAIRRKEALQAAARLGATIEFLKLDGDAHLEVKAAHAIKLARLLRRLRPSLVLAPSLIENQHPDHWRLGRLVRDAARLARYGGLAELRGLYSHAIAHLLYYAVTPEAEPREQLPLMIDVSAPAVLEAWTAAMAAHRSQQKTRDYGELQLTRAHLNGLRAGVSHAIPLWPNDSLLLGSLASLTQAARVF
ncbi:MAG TPA: PIG-L family deacetylase [Opitutus sp.]|nr:PIG-L family deacetylase [Opitutus sp.]